METLGKLAPIDLKRDPEAIVTAGNASQQNDAAAACLVVAEDKPASLGLKPMGFMAGWAAAGCHPATMGLGPVPAVERLFKRLNLKWNDIDLVELNEAFAAQVLGVVKRWGFEGMDRLNVNGSGISLGHPIGATGVRIAVTLLHEMQRRKVRRGLETMCVGGGQGIAAVFETA
jgi:acetyl-CoA C-acetyltransferase